MKQHFDNLKKTYDEFENFLLKNGQLIAKDTGIGFWGVTPLKDVFELFKKVKLNEHSTFVDLGSGDGRVVLLASIFGLKATGIEADSWLVNVSLDIKNKLDIPNLDNVTILRKDFNEHSISNHDIVYVSPDKPFHRGLESKLQRELDGMLIVHGHEFLPSGFNKVNEFLIDGERFTIYNK